MSPESWVFSIDHKQIGRIIETQTLWGESFCLVWFPSTNSVARLKATSLQPALTHPSDLRSQPSSLIPQSCAYIAAAARIIDALAQDVLLAPLESSVIPLPHQIRALARAMSGDRVRYLLADEVGLGKTIEAGLILRELKLRGLARRTLVVAPRGLVTQWVAEMRTRFNEDFRLVIPGEFAAYRRLAGEENLWRVHDQVVCPIDSVKPLGARRGWSPQQVAEHNQERFENLITAGWDLVIVDEAHHLGGSTDQVARYQLGQGLAEAAPYLLLLSATPHSGKSDAFQRLLSLLDPQAFPDVGSVTHERVRPYVIRAEKRQTIDAQGHPLFQPRQTRRVAVSWENRHQPQQALYDAVTDYVREGYNQAIQDKRNAIGFLMILMQRLVTSSTRAIRSALERRLEVLRTPEEQLGAFSGLMKEEWTEMDGQEQIDTLLKARVAALRNEQTEVEWLLQMARNTEASGPDARAEALLDWLYRLQREETDPDLKVLIFTEFVATQEMLFEFLTERGFETVTLNGSMSMDDRLRAQETFAGPARILVSTDAGGEGLNLQFCHVVINYDIPWNPMRLEQRIGRVDRIGQAHVVRALNFVLDNSVEQRVQEVLEEKLQVILEEFGVDKTGDILDSSSAERLFDGLYVRAISNPEGLEDVAESILAQVRRQARLEREGLMWLAGEERFDPAEARQVLDHPLPHWVERMTVSHLKAHGGRAERQGQTWDLTWPDGEQVRHVVFSAQEAYADPTARHLTLEDARIRVLIDSLPRFVEGQPIPCVAVPGLPAGVSGWWSLWRIAIQRAATVASAGANQQRIMPLFQQDDGRVFLPTARFIWDQLISEPIDTVGAQLIAPLQTDSDSMEAFGRLSSAAETHGRAIYDNLVRSHQARREREHEKAEYAFMARRHAIEKLGLPAVRAHRLTALEQERDIWLERWAGTDEIIPEMVPLLVLRIEGERDGSLA